MFCFFFNNMNVVANAKKMTICNQGAHTECFA
jgi:hypothetical protein